MSSPKLLICLGVIFSSCRKEKVSDTSPAQTAPGIIAEAPAPQLSDLPQLSQEKVHLLPETESVRALNSPDQGITEDLEILTSLLDRYHQLFQTMPPGGLNEEITAGLRGRNTKSVALFPPTHASLDQHGQLLDRFGTPYHFHRESRDCVTIRSAGPDKKLFTDDDVLSE